MYSRDYASGTLFHDVYVFLLDIVTQLFNINWNSFLLTLLNILVVISSISPF